MEKTAGFSSYRQTADPITAGYDVADKLVNHWNSQPNPPKVYVKGYRIHHGLVGLVLTGFGFVGLAVSGTLKDEKNRGLLSSVSGMAVGAGIRLMEDDIADMPDWFNFEKNRPAPQPVLREDYLLPSHIPQNSPALSYPHIDPREFA